MTEDMQELRKEMLDSIKEIVQLNQRVFNIEKHFESDGIIEKINKNVQSLLLSRASVVGIKDGVLLVCSFIAGWWGGHK